MSDHEMVVLKVEIHLPKGDLKQLWADIKETAEEDLGLPAEEREIVKINGPKLAQTQLSVYSMMLAAIAVGHAMQQADELFEQNTI
jgi:hypothetical protein